MKLVELLTLAGTAIGAAIDHRGIPVFIDGPFNPGPVIVSSMPAVVSEDMHHTPLPTQRDSGKISWHTNQPTPNPEEIFMPGPVRIKRRRAEYFADGPVDVNEPKPTLKPVGPFQMPGPVIPLNLPTPTSNPIHRIPLPTRGPSTTSFLGGQETVTQAAPPASTLLCIPESSLCVYIPIFEDGKSQALKDTASQVSPYVPKGMMLYCVSFGDCQFEKFDGTHADIQCPMPERLIGDNGKCKFCAARNGRVHTLCGPGKISPFDRIAPAGPLLDTGKKSPVFPHVEHGILAPQGSWNETLNQTLTLAVATTSSNVTGGYSIKDNNNSTSIPYSNNAVSIQGVFPSALAASVVILSFLNVL